MPTLLAAKIQNGAAIPNAGDDDAAKRRPDRAAEIEADAIGGGRAVEILARHQQRHDRPPRRATSARRRRPKEKSSPAAGRGGDEIERDQRRESRRNDEDRDFDDDEQAPGSMTSASAPAGKVNRNNGRLTATWTSDTASGLALRLVISQPDAVSNIAVPTFENDARRPDHGESHMPNAPHCEGARAAAGGFASTLKPVSLAGGPGPAILTQSLASVSFLDRSFRGRSSIKQIQS